LNTIFETYQQLLPSMEGYITCASQVNSQRLEVGRNSTVGPQWPHFFCCQGIKDEVLDLCGPDVELSHPVCGS
jgi:hypothetical protein